VNMSTEILVSPIVSRDGGFAFDTFSTAAGLTPGFAYRRIEQASYDRKTTLHSLPRTTGFAVVACETLGEFGCRCAALLGETTMSFDRATPGDGYALHI
jgi:hypothetical protein